MLLTEGQQQTVSSLKEVPDKGSNLSMFIYICFRNRIFIYHVKQEYHWPQNF